MRINRNEFLFSISFALDFLEMGIRSNITNHNKRVSLISIRMGKALGLDEESIFDLAAYAMLHDNGFTHETFNAISENGVDRLERSLSHCIIGERNLETFPFINKRKNIIKYHHERYDGHGYFGVEGSDIPLFSRIITLADRVEIEYRMRTDRGEILTCIGSDSGTLFCPDACRAFKEISKSASFWLSLDDMFIGHEMKRELPKFDIDMNLLELLSISTILRNIIDAKSPFTGTHTKGIARIAGMMAGYFGFAEERKTKLIIAANLHDLGKIAVPNAIIDKNGKLTKDEFEVMKSHTYYTRKALEAVEGVEDVVEWAANHHEKLDGSGYPYGLARESLGFESQLLACVDIYQALTENRPYRESLGTEKVRSIMVDMAERGYINGEIASQVIEHCEGADQSAEADGGETR
ncbi:MAG: HD domain-containing protein [Synergistaceae bacterium]|nr:HD domain-containing protein [Synergistaceae bacterium]